MTRTLPTLLLVAVSALAACGPQQTASRAPQPVSDAATELEKDTPMKIEVLAEGDGPTLPEGAVALVHYTGKLADGTKFDSSHDRGEPFPVIVGKGLVIPGWDQALSKMSVGDRWVVTIPPELAYGERGAGNVIPANATLTFDMEVMGVHDIEVEVLATGDGAAIEPGATAITHYTGTLLDGTKFDSSRDRGQPFPVPVGAGRVIPGWDAALLRMRQGDRWKVTIPWQLAYGAQGQPPTIPPKANLVFDMEVMDVRPPRRR